MINNKGYWIPDAVTADVVLLSKTPGGTIVTLLIERGKEPYENQFAIPGGHMDETDSSLEDCASRELFEETGIFVHPYKLELIGVFSKKDRDPRGRYIGVAYCAWIEIDDIKKAVAGDDAKAAVIWSLEDAVDEDLAFDHKEILKIVLMQANELPNINLKH